MNRPDYLIEEHLIFLDELRESEVTNMYGASPWLRDEFPELSRKESHEIVAYWMKTFAERHKNVSKSINPRIS